MTEQQKRHLKSHMREEGRAWLWGIVVAVVIGLIAHALL